MVKHGQEVASLREESQKRTDLLKRQLADTEASRDTLETAQKSADLENERQTSDYRYRQDVHEIELGEVNSALQEAREMMESLSLRVEQTRAERDEARQLSQVAQQDLTRLNSTVLFLQDDREEHSTAISKLQNELDSTVHALNDKEHELGVATERHAVILHELKSDHGSKIESLERAIDEMQAQHDAVKDKSKKDREANFAAAAELRRVHQMPTTCCANSSPPSNTNYTKLRTWPSSVPCAYAKPSPL